ncbi:MAG: guanylate kinase [Pantoea sp. Brub]|nr:guanylate kinase [Pantoea sp. Brub]
MWNKKLIYDQIKNVILGNIYIISAPSGTGKSSLIQALLKTKTFNSTLKLSISHTTRYKRPGEINGKHYHFIEKETFKRMINNNCFIEYAIVFKNYYGTSYQEIEKYLSQGFDILLDIDWQGAKQIRSKISNTNSIFILPPSRDELYKRLCKRGQDTHNVIIKRMKQAIFEIQHYIEYDYLIINDHFDLAISELKTIIKDKRLYLSRQKIIFSSLINNLLVM